MEDKQYLDKDGLKDYDTLIKEYIDKKVAQAIEEYESTDYMEIEEFVPDNKEN